MQQDQTPPAVSAAKTAKLDMGKYFLLPYPKNVGPFHHEPFGWHKAMIEEGLTPRA